MSILSRTNTPTLLSKKGSNEVTKTVSLFDPITYQYQPLPRKSKGQIKQDLLNEYESVGKPCQGKSLEKIIDEVEDEFSRNLEFNIEKAGKLTQLSCGKKKVTLPEKSWKLQIFKEPETGIPFISDGRTSKRCLDFFKDEHEAHAKSAEEQKQVLRPLGVPLPGQNSGQYTVDNK